MKPAKLALEDARHFVAVTDLAPEGFVVHARNWYDAHAAVVSYLPDAKVTVLDERASVDHPALVKRPPVLRANSPHDYDVISDALEPRWRQKTRRLPIVAFVGAAGSGKDTAADVLVAQGFDRIAFADILKRFCQVVFHLPDDALWGPSELRNQPSGVFGVVPREALQTLGTEWGRALVDNVWVAYVASLIRRLETEDVRYYRNHGIDGLVPCPRQDRPRGIVVSDMRFVNEWIGLENTFAGRFQAYRIERKNNAHKLRGRAAKHASEQEFMKISAKVLTNHGSLEAFRAKIVKLHARLVT